jgi:hypothetical protein
MKERDVYESKVASDMDIGQLSIDGGRFGGRNLKESFQLCLCERSMTQLLFQNILY